MNTLNSKENAFSVVGLYGSAFIGFFCVILIGL